MLKVARIPDEGAGLSPSDLVGRSGRCQGLCLDCGRSAHGTGLRSRRSCADGLVGPGRRGMPDPLRHGGLGCTHRGLVRFPTCTRWKTGFSHSSSSPRTTRHSRPPPISPANSWLRHTPSARCTATCTTRMCSTSVSADGWRSTHMGWSANEHSTMPTSSRTPTSATRAGRLRPCRVDWRPGWLPWSPRRAFSPSGFFAGSLRGRGCPQLGSLATATIRAPLSTLPSIE